MPAFAETVRLALARDVMARGGAFAAPSMRQRGEERQVLCLDQSEIDRLLAAILLLQSRL